MQAPVLNIWYYALYSIDGPVFISGAQVMFSNDKNRKIEVRVIS